MAIVTSSATLDGVNAFTVFGNTFTWSNGYIPAIDPFGGNGPTVFRADLTLSGSWATQSISFDGFKTKFLIADVNDGGSRFIGSLRLGAGGGTASFGTTFVGAIQASGPGEVVLNLGGGADLVSLNRGNDKVTVGVNSVGTVLMRDGNDTFVGGNGDVEFVSLGNGNNRLTLGAGQINHASGGSGDDTVVVGVGGRIDTAALGDGANTVTVANNGRINTLTGNLGDDMVTLNGNSRILTMKLDGGNNTLTTANGNVESYYSFGGNNTLNIGAGGIQQVVLSGDGGTHVINAAGFVGSLQVTGNSTATVTVNGDADAIMLGDGDDIVTTGSGYVQLINAGDGNNIITLGASTTNGTGFVRTGNGDDLVRLNVMNPNYGVVLQGGGGINTADFSQFGVSITVSLNRFDYQSIGDLTGADIPAIGYFSFVQFQNLSGSAQADTLEGGTGNNTLKGALGNDLLSGLDGDDLLIGGRGNDRLTGGLGIDTFEFSPGGGRDRVTDFAPGADLIHFTNSLTIADITFARQGTGVLLTVGTAQVLVDNVTVAQMNDPANFLF